MSRLPQPYTCTCGHVVHDTDDAKTLRAGKFQLVLCNVCVPKAQAGARALAQFVGLGLTAFVNKRYPGVLSELRTAADLLRAAAQQDRGQGGNHAEG